MRHKWKKVGHLYDHTKLCERCGCLKDERSIGRTIYTLNGEEHHNSPTCKQAIKPNLMSKEVTTTEQRAKEEINPWPFNGHAPGNYWNTCAICKKDMIADKLCFVCLECAIISAKQALAASPDAGDWQDMNSAPKDGTPILICDDEDVVHKCLWAAWDNSDNKGRNKNWCIDGSWDGEFDSASTVNKPKKWRPLPSPPKNDNP